MNQKIEWQHIDGSKTTIDQYTAEEDLLRVLYEALKSLRGQFPSINSMETLEDILDLVDEMPMDV